MSGRLQFCNENPEGWVGKKVGRNVHIITIQGLNL